MRQNSFWQALKLKEPDIQLKTKPNNWRIQVICNVQLSQISWCFNFHFLAWLYLLHLHTAGDGVPLAEDLVQVLRAQDVPQGGLRQQPDWLKVDNLATLLCESEEKNSLIGIAL